MRVRNGISNLVVQNFLVPWPNIVDIHSSGKSQSAKTKRFFDSIIPINQISVSFVEWYQYIMKQGRSRLDRQADTDGPAYKMDESPN